VSRASRRKFAANGLPNAKGNLRPLLSLLRLRAGQSRPSATRLALVAADFRDAALRFLELRTGPRGTPDHKKNKDSSAFRLVSWKSEECE
jgi:hypothetical protein